jgi:hypothetical protein
VISDQRGATDTIPRVPLFGSSKGSASHRVQVLTLEYLIDGTVELSGQNLIRLFVLTDLSMRAARGATPPEPGGSTWAIGEDYGGLIAVAPLDAAGHEALERYASTGKHEVQADVFTGPYRVRGTILAPDDDPSVLANLGRLMVREPEVECLAPGATLGTWRPPSALLFMSQLQGIVV